MLTGQPGQESRSPIKLICQLFDECPSEPRPDRWAEFEKGLTALLPPPARSSNCQSTARPPRSARVRPPAQKRLGYVIAQLSRTGRRSRWNDGDICTVDEHSGIPSPCPPEGETSRAAVPN